MGAPADARVCWSKDETEKKLLVRNFVPEKHRQEVERVLAEALEGKDSDGYTFPLITRRGECRDILLNATARLGASREVIGVIGVGQDITELNAQRKQVQLIADDLARLIDTANATIFGTDITGKVTVWNKKLAEITGLSQDLAMGQPFVQKFISEEYREGVAFSLLKCMTNDKR